MNIQRLPQAVDLAKKVGRVLLATADSQGRPHMAAAGKLELAEDNSVAVTEWFCPGTVANLANNKCLAIVVWDESSDSGYQMLGRLEKLQDLGILDGYTQAEDTGPAMPQVQRQLLINVDRIIDFKLGPHSDDES